MHGTDNKVHARYLPTKHTHSLTEATSSYPISDLRNFKNAKEKII
jgi:hypothetical protein